MKRLLLLPLLVLGFAAAAPASANDYTVSITKAGFPAAVTIKNGDQVVWKNNDTVNRQVVADDGTWQSPVLAPGESWSRIFVDGGTFKYHGAFKPSQRGAIVVNATRATLISRKSANTITITRTVRLQGTVSEIGSEGEQVVIQAKPRGTSTYRVVARTVTHNGVWTVMVKPRRTTFYRAVWQNVPSNDHIINVKPLVRLKQLGRRLFSVGVHADTTLVRHRVVIQRFNKRTHKWHSFTSVRLSHFKASRSEYDSIGSFTLRLPHGAIIRALITKRQAGPLMYGPAWSLARRV